MIIFGPLLHIKNENLPKGVRKVEMLLANNDLLNLKTTIAAYERQSLITAVEDSIKLYQNLRKEIFKEDIIQRIAAEKEVLKYLKAMNS